MEPINTVREEHIKEMIDKREWIIDNSRYIAISKYPKAQYLGKPLQLVYYFDLWKNTNINLINRGKEKC